MGPGSEVVSRAYKTGVASLVSKNGVVFEDCKTEVALPSRYFLRVHFPTLVRPRTCRPRNTRTGPQLPSRLRVAHVSDSPRPQSNRQQRETTAEQNRRFSFSVLIISTKWKCIKLRKQVPMRNENKI